VKTGQFGKRRFFAVLGAVALAAGALATFAPAIGAQEDVEPAAAGDKQTVYVVWADGTTSNCVSPTDENFKNDIYYGETLTDETCPDLPTTITSSSKLHVSCSKTASEQSALDPAPLFLEIVKYKADRISERNPEGIEKQCASGAEADGTFVVKKDFSDNSTGSVTTAATCSVSSTPDSAPASEATPAEYDLTWAAFSVELKFNKEDKPGEDEVTVNGTTTKQKDVDASVWDAALAQAQALYATPVNASCTGTETVPAGYTADQSDCADVQILWGQSGECTIVNTPSAQTGPGAVELQPAFTG